MEELNKIANDTANDIEKLLDEKRRRYRAYECKSRAGSTPYASKRKKKHKRKKKIVMELELQNGGRIADRFNEMLNVIPFKNVSYRL